MSDMCRNLTDTLPSVIRCTDIYPLNKKLYVNSKQESKVVITRCGKYILYRVIDTTCGVWNPDTFTNSAYIYFSLSLMFPIVYLPNLVRSVEVTDAVSVGCEKIFDITGKFDEENWLEEPLPPGSVLLLTGGGCCWCNEVVVSNAP